MLKTLPSRSDAHVFGHLHQIKAFLETRYKIFRSFPALGLALSGCVPLKLSQFLSLPSLRPAPLSERTLFTSSQSTEALTATKVSAQDSEQTPTVTEVGESPEENNADTSTAHPVPKPALEPSLSSILIPAPLSPQGTAPMGSDEASEALRILNTLPVKAAPLRPVLPVPSSEMPGAISTVTDAIPAMTFPQPGSHRKTA